MSRLIQRSFSEPERQGMDWDIIWRSEDRGLIKSWEIGRKLAKLKPNLAAAALANELPPLNWKGGVSKQLIKREKFGSLRYLAQWQGLRGEDLVVDLDAEFTFICAKTQMQVTFTGDAGKFANQIDESDDKA